MLLHVFWSLFYDVLFLKIDQIFCFVAELNLIEKLILSLAALLAM